MSTFSLSGGGTVGPFEATNRESMLIVVGPTQDFATRTLTVEVEGAAGDWLPLSTYTEEFELKLDSFTAPVRLSLDGAATPAIDGVVHGS